MVYGVFASGEKMGLLECIPRQFDLKRPILPFSASAVPEGMITSQFVK